MARLSGFTYREVTMTLRRLSDFASIEVRGEAVKSGGTQRGEDPQPSQPIPVIFPRARFGRFANRPVST